MKKLAIFLLTLSTLSAEPLTDFQQDKKLAIQNSILTQVNGKIISMIDIKKKMDVTFHQNYPQIEHSSLARCQFYEASWKHVLKEMIDQELIIADAADKEIKVTDGEVREALEERFGPNVTHTLDAIGLTRSEAWDMIKNEMIVQRMMWWFVHQKAQMTITPQDIKHAYYLYQKEHPSYTEWTYRVVSIRIDVDGEEAAQQTHQLLLLSGKSPDLLQTELKNLERPGMTISISNPYTAKTQDLSEIHKKSIETLSPGSYSAPVAQLSRRDNQMVHRIFYLETKTDVPAPSFHQVASQLRDELVQKASMEESQAYITKLRKHYGYETILPSLENLHPFSLQ
ncbi:MAG: hypothetical protein A3D96_01395 [Chlamydiae bacterium RIFCSPHIGHO2_12_FULL_44_59]|nr:MAG: hypothetical protein A2796_00970 [Chlamydiae bacterium RIFCSPHIGHO2_01_FULL_44_39]OGN58881.1 MAG: hypothetical protein A3C42_05095 [Chlamydiae bacterium RIFCSPHIGHO2_02_FULL_45_9]OGN60517.1 MAG: hypothetical protein A3D96_01395 [Chlamydiae bacterium RIFCSPHIGHO2_12_FULL_44_59]OGN65971.1 MAG: hypothetical protein A2978_04685 [Chlamydiae bacterium RIFCSPLOWO2_01_FULL_44_52]OGN68786.1 MAG: hypothetical protein A3I67_00345 [Chlamydiae bacterium RIFCSPLOWO2_02_FULL_45_22]OGN70427.1 MAG: hyp